MSSHPHGTIIVVAAGPGIGLSVARKFASEGFGQIILMSRNTSRLSGEVARIKDAASDAGGRSDVSVQVVSVDLSVKSSVQKALQEVDEHLTPELPLEVVYYNAARVAPSELGKFPVEELESDMTIAITSMYMFSSWAMPKLTELAKKSSSSTKPAFLVTSGLLWKAPASSRFSLSVCKAGQYNLVNSLYKEYKAQGVHAALIVVGGVVEDSAKVTTAANVAENAWGLYSQPEGKWTLDITLLEPGYSVP